VDLITELVDSWDPYNIMTQCVDARNFGYQPFEVIWKATNKKWLITELISKPPEWFNYSTENQLQFISKSNPQGKVVPEAKFIVARNRPSYLNPYGESHLSRCFWPVTFKKGGISFMIKFIEKYGMPWVVGKQPRNISKKETEKFLKDLHQMVQDAVSVIPDDSSVDLKDHGGRSSSSDAYLAGIHYFDSAINKALLSNELSTSVSKEGGDVRGSGETQMEVSHKVIRSVAQMAEHVINCAIKLMWAQNYTGTAPKVRIYEPKKVQKERAERDQILGNTGIQFTKKYYMDNYALAEDDFEIAEKKEEPTNEPIEPSLNADFMDSIIQPIKEFNEHIAWQKKPPYKKPEDIEEYSDKNASVLGKVISWFKSIGKNETAKFQEDKILENSINSQNLIDQLIEFSAGEDAAEITQEQLEQTLKPLIDLVNSSSNYEEVMSELAGIYPDMNTEQLEERLARAYFLADAIGRITEQENGDLD